MSRVSEIAACLENGTIPVTKHVVDACLEVSSIFNSLVKYRREHPEKAGDIFLTLLHLHTKDTESIQKIHISWITQAFHKSVELKEFHTIGVQSYDFPPPLSEYCVFISKQPFDSKKCPICKTRYYSDVNKTRCFMAHVDGKSDVSVHDRVALAEFWDSVMTMEQKVDISLKTQLYLANVNEELLFEPWMYRLVDIPEGDLDVSGEILMEALFIASECTSFFRVKNTGKNTVVHKKNKKEKMKKPSSTVQIESSRDFLSCIADAIIREITILYSEYQEQQFMSELLQNDTNDNKSKKSKMQKKKKKMSRKQYLEWLDRKIFSSSTIVDDWTIQS